MISEINTEVFASVDSTLFTSELSRAQLRNILDQMPEGVLFACASDKVPVLINKKGAELLGIASDELTLDLCEQRWRLIDSDGKPVSSHQMPVAAALRGEAIRDSEYGFIAPDGLLRHHLVNSGPVLAADGTVSGAMVVFSDITERKRTEEALRIAARGVSATTGEAFFHSMLRCLAEILEVDFAFIGEIAADSADTIRSTAACAYGKIVDGFEYRLANSPCENVISKQLCCYAERVQQLFPQDRLLAEWKVESYLGTPLWSSSNRSLGLLVLMDTKPLASVELALSLIQIFAVRAAAELERMHAEKALKENEQRYRDLFENANDIIYTHDLEGNFTSINRAAEQLVGYSQAEALKLNISHVVVPEHLELARNSILRSLTGEAVPVYDLEILTKDGRRLALELNIRLIYEGGVPIGFQGIARDITGRLQAEQERVALLERERAARNEAERERASLNATIEQMAEGLLVNDENAMVVRANRHAQRIFGFTLEQMQADSDFALPKTRFHDKDGRPVAVEDLPIQTALRNKRLTSARLWYDRPDGARVLVSLTVSPFFDDQNQLSGSIMLVRDVTEQQREYEQIQQADKLRALGQLASGVAHNFNNALAAVIGYTQLALPKVKDPNIEKYLRVVEQSAKDAARMVERIQNFSRSRTQSDYLIRFRISDIVRDAIEITRPRWRDDAEALGIRLDVSLDWQADEALLVRGEPSELREVFVNVIFNALDAMTIGGHLKITATEEDSNVLISFRDTGGGMTEEIKRRIFEPFFTTKGASGLGMGLSESYRIIERHRGRIDVESHPRQGTNFTFRLPIARQVERVSPVVAATAATNSARVLVIDDEKFVRKVLTAMLTEQGHCVAEASGAEEAFALVETQEFDIVFTDLAMPKVDGIATAAGIKGLRPDTKIVLMSGYGADKALERARGSGMIDAAISKPFKTGELQEVIRKMVSGE